MKLQADNMGGVYEVEEFEGEVLSQEDFYAALKSNPEDVVICCEADAEWCHKIEQEYGIAWIDA